MAIRGNPRRIFCDGVSWGELDNASFDDVISYFSKRVEVCCFNPINKLLLPEYKTTGLIILSVISSLIDLLSQYYYADSDLKHKDKYKKFLREHFPEFKQKVSLKKLPHVKDLADFFYEGFRCQILHNFMLSEYSTIGWKTEIVLLHTWDNTKDLKEIIVNPRLLMERLEVVFNQYTDALLDQKNSGLRESFVKRMYIDTGAKLRI